MAQELQESVFEYLARMRTEFVVSRIMEHYKKSCHMNPENIINNAIKEMEEAQEQEPTDNIGDKIEQEFNKRNGELTDDERLMAYNYFTRDYRRAEYHIGKNLKLALEKDPESQEHREHLSKAWDLAKRVEENTKRVGRICRIEKLIKKICPDNLIDRTTDTVNRQLKIKSDEWQNIRELLYFVTEFPYSSQEIIPLHTGMKEAVKREDYETAARLRDKIRSIISRYEPQ